MEQQIFDQINLANSIVITAHKSPDGDSVGSSLALYHICKDLGKNVLVCFPDEVPSFLTWVDGAKDILVFERQQELVTECMLNTDLLFALDYNGSGRLGNEMGQVFEDSKAFKIMIDHHTNPSDFVNISYSFPTICSTCELIYQVAENANRLDVITPTVGKAIYLGIMTDTGSFRFPSLTAKTHRILANLLEIGVKHYEVHESVYDTNTTDRLKLRGYALSEKLEVINNEVAIISLTNQEMERYNHQKGDTEGLVNMALSVEGMKIAAFFNEGDEYVKISFRSKGTNNKVNEMSQAYFNGGGHINAAGGRFDGTLADAISKFKSVVYEFLDKN